MPEDNKTAAISQPKPMLHPKELSSEYHKAHKQLMLWAAILFVWELVGIDLEKAKDAEGYAGALVRSIKSPQAVPWVLLFLVLYFLFKCSMEWAQCFIERRKMPFARADFVAAWTVALAAIALYVGQAMSRVQFANVVQTKTKAVLGLVYGLSGGGFLILGLFLFRETLNEEGNGGIRLRIAMATLWVGAAALCVIALAFRLSKVFFVAGFLISIGVGLMIRIGRRIRRARPTWPKN
jgi:hypothetical protein